MPGVEGALSFSFFLPQPSPFFNLPQTFYLLLALSFEWRYSARPVRRTNLKGTGLVCFYMSIHLFTYHLDQDTEHF